MHGVDATLQRLQPVALLDDLGSMAVGLGLTRELERGLRGRLLLRPHVGPDDAADLHRGVRRDTHLAAEVILFGLVRHVHARAIHVELPAVVDAADAVLLVPAQPERRKAVGAPLAHQAYAAGRVAEGNEVLTEDAQAQGIAVGMRQLMRDEDRLPVAAHQLAHRRTGPHAGQSFVVPGRKHAWLPLVVVEFRCLYAPQGKPVNEPTHPPRSNRRKSVTSGTSSRCSVMSMTSLIVASLSSVPAWTAQARNF